MRGSEERARGGWAEKQIGAELRRLGGAELLADASAEAREHAGRRRHELLTARDGSGDHGHDRLLEEEMLARLEVLVRRLDHARRTASDAPPADDAAEVERVAGPREKPELAASLVADPSVPSIARVYDFALGGQLNFEADRRAGYEIAAALPEACDLARDCRAFVRRVVTWLVTQAGIDQIVDVGSGLPTAGNVHEIARRHRDGVRVVYVDNDPVVLAHGRALLADDPATAVVGADLRDPESILRHPDTVRLIDRERPFAVLASCVLHHLPDSDDPPALLDAVTAELSPGSYLAVANFVATPDEPRVAEIERGFLTSGLGSGRFRPIAEHHRYFDGLELVEPGLVYANDWHPDEHTRRDSPVRRLHLAGVGRRT